MRSALLVPVKRFSSAKRRLSAVLDPAQRAELARWLAERTLAAAGSLDRYVACDDETVRTWARDVGAGVMWTPHRGLNGAVDTSRRWLLAKGYDHVVIAHSDLPLASRLDRLVRAGTITLVPDLRRDGTNVVSLPAGCSMRAGYGAGSFERHRLRAERTGLAVEVMDDPALGTDVDTPYDLVRSAVAAVLPPWARGLARANGRTSRSAG